MLFDSPTQSEHYFCTGVRIHECGAGNNKEFDWARQLTDSVLGLSVTAQPLSSPACAGGCKHKPAREKIQLQQVLWQYSWITIPVNIAISVTTMVNLKRQITVQVSITKKCSIANTMMRMTLFLTISQMVRLSLLLLVVMMKNIHGSECGRIQSGFGWHAVSQKLRAIQYYRVLNIIILKLYNILYFL
jgi:hypothetical protein